jgi:hypothetical protein
MRAVGRIASPDLKSKGRWSRSPAHFLDEIGGIFGSGKAWAGEVDRGRFTDQFVNLTILLDSVDRASLGMFRDLANQFHGLGFVAWLGRVVGGNDHFDLDGHHGSTTADQPGCLESFARDSPRSHTVEEVNRHQIRDARLGQERPDSLEFGAIG